MHFQLTPVFNAPIARLSWANYFISNISFSFIKTKLSSNLFNKNREMNNRKKKIWLKRSKLVGIKIDELKCVLPHENSVMFSKHTEKFNRNINEVHKLDVMFWFFTVHIHMKIGASMVEMSLDLCKNMVDIICVEAWCEHKKVLSKCSQKKKRRKESIRKKRWRNWRKKVKEFLVLALIASTVHLQVANKKKITQ